MQSADNGCLDHTKARSACIRIWSQWGSLAPYGNKSTPSHGNRAERPGALQGSRSRHNSYQARPTRVTQRTLSPRLFSLGHLSI